MVPLWKMMISCSNFAAVAVVVEEEVVVVG